jgi:DNA-directed RNA polymerase specialized sigma24 family protein
MEYNSLYDNHKQTLLRFVGTLIRNEAEAHELVEEIVSPDRMHSSYPLMHNR